METVNSNIYKKKLESHLQKLRHILDSGWASSMIGYSLASNRDLENKPRMFKVVYRLAYRPRKENFNI